MKSKQLRFMMLSLTMRGQISAEFAKQFAESEFEKYRIIQDKFFKSDFDRFNQNLLEFPDDIHYH